MMTREDFVRMFAKATGGDLSVLEINQIDAIYDLVSSLRDELGQKPAPRAATFAEALEAVHGGGGFVPVPDPNDPRDEHPDPLARASGGAFSLDPPDPHDPGDEHRAKPTGLPPTADILARLDAIIAHYDDSRWPEEVDRALDDARHEIRRLRESRYDPAKVEALMDAADRAIRWASGIRCGYCGNNHVTPHATLCPAPQMIAAYRDLRPPAPAEAALASAPPPPGVTP